MAIDRNLEEALARDRQVPDLHPAAAVADARVPQPEQPTISAVVSTTQPQLVVHLIWEPTTNRGKSNSAVALSLR